MKNICIFLVYLFFGNFLLSAQSNFNYDVELIPVQIPGLQGLHSYAFGQANGKWLIVGGRKDGIHARQPFNAFPVSQNNTDIIVIDINSFQFWSAPVMSLPTGISEQLQSTNMNFYQDEDTLYIAGGYSFSASANGHITFPNLTSIQVSDLIDAIVNGNAINNYFKQITDQNFAVTGGQLGKIDNTFYLVGGHRFDGNYNPMGQPTFTQAYTNQIRRFSINNSGSQLSYSNYNTITDPVHLRRRDYNLLPQIFPDGTHGYTVSSGVFQVNIDLPFLYPVDITATGYIPVTNFNQYLSNYHSAKACLYDSTNNIMHNLFFGGISRYYYQNGNLIQDNNVPFVKTISRVSRLSDGTITEYLLPAEMPALQGAGAEFIPNLSLPHYKSEIFKLSYFLNDTILLGHIYGGIYSPTLNPFVNNQTNNTSADNSVYAVRLIKNNSVSVQEIDGKNPFSIEIFPNPAGELVNIQFELKEKTVVDFFFTSTDGKIIQKGSWGELDPGLNKKIIKLESGEESALIITVIFNNRYYLTKKVAKI